MNHYAPYGEPWGEQGTAQTPFGFTGEPTDQNGLVHLRARYYNPALGVFPTLDPLEGSPLLPLGINRYAYVQGDPVNMADPSGMIYESPVRFDSCKPRLSKCDCEDLNLHRDPECIALCISLPIIGATAPIAASPISPIKLPNSQVQWAYNAEVYIDTGPYDAGCNRAQDLRTGVGAACCPDTPDGCLQSPLSSVTALGTLTSEGIWTHAHYLGRDANWSVVAGRFQSQSPNQEWIRIRGVFGSVALDLANIKVSQGSDHAIMMDFPLVATGYGYSIPLTAQYFGIPVPVNKGAISTSSVVIFTYRDTKGQAKADTPYVFAAAVVTEKSDGYYVVYRGGSLIFDGASGGGVFDFSGNLIGVVAASNPREDADAPGFIGSLK